MSDAALAADVPAVPPTMMTQADYARHRGVSRQAVHKAIEAGKIAVADDGKIDAAAADFALGEARERLDEPREPAAPAESAALTRARTATEVYKARLAQLEFDERSRTLLPAADVRQAIEQIAAGIARELELMPTMADDLYAAGTRGGVAALRDALIARRDELLRNLVTRMSGLAAGRLEATQ